MSIQLTPTAIKEVKRIMKDTGKQDWGVRLGVKGGGCSGLEYNMDLEEAPQDHDRVNDVEGVKIFVDPKSYLYLNGLTLDFSNELMGGGFKFVNPNASRTCSCGQSFAV